MPFTICIKSYKHKNKYPFTRPLNDCGDITMISYNMVKYLGPLLDYTGSTAVFPKLCDTATKVLQLTHRSTAGYI